MPSHYPSNDSEQITNIGVSWLERVLLKIKYVVYVRDTFWKFMETLHMNVRTKRYLRLVMYMVAICMGLQNGLNLCRYGKIIILIPSIIAICERGFQKQNAFKTTCARS